VFGLTYGKTSFMSQAKSFPRGIELTPDVHYTSVFKGEYVDHAQYNHETTAQIVGVQRNEDAFKKVRDRLILSRQG
jgi:K+/H+ antiporter YhaU regulatory subunit KhtT